MSTPSTDPGRKPTFGQRVRDLIQMLESLPRTELTRGQRAIRFTRRLWSTAWQQMKMDRAGSNAAALTFRTLFSLVPLLVLAAILTKSIISVDTFLESIDELMHWLHMDEVKVSIPGRDGSETVVLESWITTQAKQVKATDVTGLTWIGILVVLYSVVRLIEEVDSTFNFITRSTPGGWLRRRIWVYLGVLIFAPILTIAAGFVLDWGVSRLAELIGAWGWVVPTIQILITLVLVWLLLRLCYRAIPARVIRPRPASIGAASATALLVIGQWLLIFYIDRALRTSPLGGGLGFLPVFMFWLYMMWLSILFGLEITMVAQSMGDLRDGEPKETAGD